MVNPQVSNCSSEHVPPNTTYTCSGLDLETNYSLTVSAVNCGNQLGENTSFSVLPRNSGMCIISYVCGAIKNHKL